MTIADPSPHPVKARLRDHYLAELAEQVVLLEANVASVEQARDRGSLDSLRRRVNHLTEAAVAFGDLELAGQGEAVETELRHIFRRADCPVSTYLLRQCRALIAAVRAAVGS